MKFLANETQYLVKLFQKYSSWDFSIHPYTFATLETQQERELFFFSGSLLCSFIGRIKLRVGVVLWTEFRSDVALLSNFQLFLLAACVCVCLFLFCWDAIDSHLSSQLSEIDYGFGKCKTIAFHFFLIQTEIWWAENLAYAHPRLYIIIFFYFSVCAECFLFSFSFRCYYITQMVEPFIVLTIIIHGGDGILGYSSKLLSTRSHACHSDSIKKNEEEEIGLQENRCRRGLDPCVWNKSRIEANWMKKKINCWVFVFLQCQR